LPTVAAASRPRASLDPMNVGTWRFACSRSGRSAHPARGGEAGRRDGGMSSRGASQCGRRRTLAQGARCAQQQDNPYAEAGPLPATGELFLMILLGASRRPGRHWSLMIWASIQPRVTRGRRAVDRQLAVGRGWARGRRGC
jgi:hypothetical protein